MTTSPLIGPETFADYVNRTIWNGERDHWLDIEDSNFMKTYQPLKPKF